MKLKFLGILGLLPVIFTAIPIHSQVNLAQLLTNTVRQNQPWMQVDTHLDSLLVNVEINQGVVTSTVTFQYTAGKGLLNSWETRPCADASCVSEPKWVETDSLETSTYFELKPNTVVTEMFLWVGQEKVRADLQERGLASAQYESIVQRRLDPALLETWGHDQYSLRIFPIKTGESRRLEIQFIQGMTGKAATSEVVLPVWHSLGYPGYVDPSMPTRKLGAVKVTARALDGQIYTLNWPGLGEVRIGDIQVQLKAQDVQELGHGRLSTTTTLCSDCLSTYGGADSEARYFGAMAELVHKELKFAPEPTERIVLIDVDGRSDAANLDHARKLALLAMKGYGQSPNRINLFYRDAAGRLVSAFRTSESMTPANLRQAYTHVKMAYPSPTAAHETAIDQWLKSRASQSATALILLNDEETQYPAYRDPGPDIEAQKKYSMEYHELVQSHNAKLALRSQKLAELLNKEKVTLFGYWRDYNIAQTATLTGGYQLGYLHGHYQPPILQSTEKGQPVTDTWNVPPLFGPGRYDGHGGIRNLKVTLDGLPVREFSHVQRTSASYRHYLGRPMQTNGPAITIDASIWPMPGNPGADTTRLYMAGKHSIPGTVNIGISGIIGGLNFVENFKANLRSRSGPPQAGKLWALVGSESLADSGKGTEARVQQLGKKYHIINRQMSLLALEPGMKLWDSLPAGQLTNRPEMTGDLNRFAAIPTSGDPAKYNPGLSLDKLSLEDILAGNVASLTPTLHVGSPKLELTTAQGGRRVILSGINDLDTWRVTVIDSRGRTVARPALENSGGRIEGVISHSNLRGTYWVVAESGSNRMTQRMVIMP